MDSCQKFLLYVGAFLAFGSMMQTAGHFWAAEFLFSEILANIFCLYAFGIIIYLGIHMQDLKEEDRIREENFLLKERVKALESEIDDFLFYQESQNKKF